MAELGQLVRGMAWRAGEADIEEERQAAWGTGDKPGALTALAASPDGRVWAGFKHGRLEVYTPSGRLFWKKVSASLSGRQAICSL